MSKQREIAQEFEGEQLSHVFVGRRDGEARPTVILIPTVMGVSDLEIGFGKQLVELGYNAFVADTFGKKFRGSDRDTMFGELNRLKSDRVALLRRLQSILEEARAQDEVESGSVVVAGYCFGGMDPHRRRRLVPIVPILARRREQRTIGLEDRRRMVDLRWRLAERNDDLLRRGEEGEASEHNSRR